MADKQYTKQEIINLADSVYGRCNRCEKYEPVCYNPGYNNNKLFKNVGSGCYYAAKLPWGETHWCWFGCPKDIQKEAMELRSLTWENLVNSEKIR